MDLATKQKIKSKIKNKGYYKTQSWFQNGLKILIQSKLELVQKEIMFMNWKSLSQSKMKQQANYQNPTNNQ